MMSEIRCDSPLIGKKEGREGGTWGKARKQEHTDAPSTLRPKQFQTLNWQWRFKVTFELMYFGAFCYSI